MWWTLLFARALATPPDIMEAQATVLCHSDTAVGFLLTSRANHGSHYTAVSALRLMRLSPTGALDVVDHGRLRADYTNLDTPGNPPNLSPELPEVAPPALMAQLTTWGLTNCLGPPPPRDVTLAVSGRDALQLQLTLDQELRALPLTLFDPRGPHGAASRYPSGAVTAGPVEYLSEEGTTNITGWWALSDHVVLQVAVDTGMGHFDAFGVVARPAFDTARGYLLNSRGLAHHRAERFDDATGWFDKARRADPTNTTARFNLACAHARLGRGQTAAIVLKDMPKEGLAKRIAADHDFDGVRANEHFATFVASLP